MVDHIHFGGESDSDEIPIAFGRKFDSLPVAECQIRPTPGRGEPHLSGTVMHHAYAVGRSNGFSLS